MPFLSRSREEREWLHASAAAKLLHHSVFLWRGHRFHLVSETQLLELATAGHVTVQTILQDHIRDYANPIEHILNIFYCSIEHISTHIFILQ